MRFKVSVSSQQQDGMGGKEEDGMGPLKAMGNLFSKYGKDQNLGQHLPGRSGVWQEHQEAWVVHIGIIWVLVAIPSTCLCRLLRIKE